MSEGLVPIILKKTYQVHLKPRGEVCNRLSKGTKVFSLKEKDGWIKITWRNCKKKGWIHIMNP